jgi:hypothetical protein
MMERFRISLLIAAAAIASVPVMASAQDWRRGGDGQVRASRSERDDSNRGGPRQQYQPAPAAAPAPQPPRQDVRREQADYRQARPQGRPQGAQVGGAPARWAGERGDDRRGQDAARAGWADRQNDRGTYAQNGNDRPDGDRRWNGGNYGRDDRRWDNNRRDGDRHWNGDNRGRDGRSDWRPGNNRGNDWRGNDWRNNAWRNHPQANWRNDSRYNWRGWRSGHRDLFRNRYVAPRGWNYGYRPFYAGAFLQPFFYSQSYWLADPWQYRLPPVEGPYRWVRYYDDVLLVDVQTGEVVDVIEDFFW